jgi:2C-methyl-D-erythritol 2,4-cyclodiphosphate synthase
MRESDEYNQRTSDADMKSAALVDATLTRRTLRMVQKTFPFSSALLTSAGVTTTKLPNLSAQLHTVGSH